MNVADIAVLGAGPAGMAAAALAARRGARVVLLDENAAPGGQAPSHAGCWCWTLAPNGDGTTGR